MSNPRKKIGEGRERILYAEVDGICPLCTRPLQFKKNGKVYKCYEIAHIYPLNPTPKELNTLKDEPRLGSDVNDIENLILLCTDCHERFDKERTVQEYREVFAIKEKLIHQNQIKDVYYSFTIEGEINHIISVLYSGLSEDVAKLNYSALKIDDKTDHSMPQILKRRIKDDVSDYYLLIKDKFSEMDKNDPGTFDLIASQVRSFYLKTKKVTNNQEEIFNIVAEWLHTKTGKHSFEASKVVVSFFIQNCEVFS
jgi:HNH endonuclease